MISSATGKISRARCTSARRPAALRWASGAIWVTNADGDTVSRIDPVDERPSSRRSPSARVRAGSRPARRRLGGEQPGRHRLADRPRRPTRVVQTIHVGNGPVGIVYATGSVWVANTGDGTITRIDANTGMPAEDAPSRGDRARVRGRNAVGERQDGKPRGANRSDHGTSRAADHGRERPLGDRLRQRRRLGGEQPGRDGLANRSGDELGHERHSDGKRARGRRRRPARRLGDQPVRRHSGADRSADEPGGASGSASGTVRREWRPQAATCSLRSASPAPATAAAR